MPESWPTPEPESPAIQTNEAPPADLPVNDAAPEAAAPAAPVDDGLVDYVNPSDGSSHRVTPAIAEMLVERAYNAAPAAPRQAAPRQTEPEPGDLDENEKRFMQRSGLQRLVSRFDVYEESTRKSELKKSVLDEGATHLKNFHVAHPTTRSDPKIRELVEKRCTSWLEKLTDKGVGVSANELRQYHRELADDYATTRSETVRANAQARAENASNAAPPAGMAAPKSGGTELDYTNKQSVRQAALNALQRHRAKSA